MAELSGTLADLAAKVAEGEPLLPADRDALVSDADVLSLGMLADQVRRRLHQNRASFVRVVRVRLDGEMHLLADLPAAAGEILVEGPVDDLAAASRGVTEIIRRAGGRPVSAFSLAELEHYASSAGRDLIDVLKSLREAGLELIAQAEFDHLQHSLASCAAVAEAGLRLARVTVDEQPRQGLLSLLAELRSVQSALGSLRVFAPLPRKLSAASPSTGYDDVRQVALARLLVDNIPSVQVDWALYGPKLAQVALTFGADDVDGVSASEGTEGWRRSPLQEIRRNIRAASLVPLERNGRFELLPA